MYLPPMLLMHSSTHFSSLPIFMSLWSALEHMSSVIVPVKVWLAPIIKAAEAANTASVFFIGLSR